jgi:hypothetical protein
MSASVKSNDWQCVGVATIGGASGLGGAVTFFQFRSKKADFLGEYIFAAGGLGVGGSLNSGVAPSPSDFATGGRNINYWSDIKGSRAFSADDLDNCLGEMGSAGVSGGYGYSLVFISAGIFDLLFLNQYIGGWGIGVGMSASIMKGLWKRLSVKNYS